MILELDLVQVFLELPLGLLFFLSPDLRKRRLALCGLLRRLGLPLRKLIRVRGKSVVLPPVRHAVNDAVDALDDFRNLGNDRVPHRDKRRPEGLLEPCHMHLQLRHVVRELRRALRVEDAFLLKTLRRRLVCRLQLVHEVEEELCAHAEPIGVLLDPPCGLRLLETLRQTVESLRLVNDLPFAVLERDAELVQRLRHKVPVLACRQYLPAKGREPSVQRVGVASARREARDGDELLRLLRRDADLAPQIVHGRLGACCVHHGVLELAQDADSHCKRGGYGCRRGVKAGKTLDKAVYAAARLLGRKRKVLQTSESVSCPLAPAAHAEYRGKAALLRFHLRRVELLLHQPSLCRTLHPVRRSALLRLLKVPLENQRLLVLYLELLRNGLVLDLDLVEDRPGPLQLGHVDVGLNLNLPVLAVQFCKGVLHAPVRQGKPLVKLGEVNAQRQVKARYRLSLVRHQNTTSSM